MSDEKFQFELVAPEKLILSRSVAMVTVPGGEGEYGVLAGHAPMITTVKPGVIEVFDSKNGTPSERFFVAYGFAEVTEKRCTILAEDAVTVAELNRGALQSEMTALSEQLANASEEDRQALQTKQEILTAKILAAA